MAKAKKHEMTKEELRAPDEVQVALKGFWEKLYKHRKLILAGVVVLIGIGVVVWVVSSGKRSSREARNDQLAEAAAAVGGSVGPEPAGLDERIAKLPRPPRFDTEGARVAAADAGLQKYLAENGSADVAELVKITAANAKLNKGDAAGALADVEAWLAAYPSSMVRPIALELKGRAQAAAGKKDDALKTFDELAKLVGPGQLRALALQQAGDLNNPVLNAGAGDAAAAKTAYQAALAALPPEEPDQATMIIGKAGLRGTIENHMGLLP